MCSRNVSGGRMNSTKSWHREFLGLVFRQPTNTNRIQMRQAHLHLATQPFYVSTTFNPNQSQKKLAKNIKSSTSLLTFIEAKTIVERYTQSYRTNNTKMTNPTNFVAGNDILIGTVFANLCFLFYSLFKMNKTRAKRFGEMGDTRGEQVWNVLLFILNYPFVRTVCAAFTVYHSWPV